MGDAKLCLFLLLSTLALTYAQEEEHASCLLAQRYKTFHKYEYQYEAESLNAINGASQLRNGPKGSCKVEIEVPQSCSYILRTTGCSLSEVVDTDAEGNPVFGPAAGSDAFAAAMEKHPLKVVVEGVYDVKLYPEEDEPMTILNIKRGIVSALAVPLLEEDKNKRMPTIHGMCKTDNTVNAREDIATDITLTRDLSRCDNFIPQRDHTSPLALISGMHYPLSQLIRSSQTCNYKFDNENKHMTSGACTENHILVPFSHKGQYGVTNTGKQTLTLLEVSAYNERVFDNYEANLKGLAMEAAEDRSAVQDKDAGLAVLRELATLSQSNNGENRAHLFQKLVSMVRGMKQETLSPAVPEALEISGPLTYQVLAQCGTPECSSALMQILRTFDTSAVEVDAAVFTMGLLPNPSALLVNDMLAMAQYKQSKPIMYALSNAVKRFYKAEGKLTPEIHAVAEFMAAHLGDCSGDQEHIFMTLRVIGNMAAAMGAASPALRTAVIQCVNQPAATLEVQQAAIQAYRQTPVPEEGREILMQVLLDSASPLQKRVAAYLVLMKDPQTSELAQLATALPIEENQQAKSFVISHLTNILASTEPETQGLRQKILDALQGNDVGTVMDPTKFSRNYKVASVEGNMIFEGASYLPREVMLEMTLKAFGYDIDMLEVGMEGKGLEPTVETLFGEHGFFPDTVLKTIFFVSDKMPHEINEVLKNMLPALKADRKKRQTSQNLVREIGRNINKLVRDLKAQESPEAMVYLRLMGNELGYLKTKDMEEMAYSAALMIDNMVKMFPTDLIKGLMTKEDNEVFAHYIFMDNEFLLPTATGVPLKIALSGTFTPGIKGGIAQSAANMAEFSFMPSAGVEFVTRVGSHIPEYVLSGLEMHTNLYHESGLRAKIAVSESEVKLTIPALQSPAKLISITNSLVAVTSAEVKKILPIVEDKVDVSECTPVFAGMKYCTVLQYTDASSHDTVPYFPFTGDSKLAVELHPTGDVSEYSATVTYKLLMEGEEGNQKVDTVKMVLKAEGAEPTEATATVKYNRRKNVITTDIQIPDYDLEVGLRLGVVDENTKGKGTHSISIDLINKNIPQLSLVGRAKIEALKDAMLQVQLLVPSLKADATVTAHLKRDEELQLELESDIKLPETTSVQKISLKYDNSKIEAEVKSDMNSEIQNILPIVEEIKKIVNDALDLQVGQTDMKVRHILTKSVEATNIYLEKYAADIPYIQTLRVPEMPEITLPEKLFLNAEAKAAYHFNDDRFTLTLPMPLGGKSTEELNFPPALTTPRLSLPQFGLEVHSMQIPIPELFVPETITVFVPLFGKAEVSTKVNSNLYDLEASASAGRDAVETPSYSAKIEVAGNSPVDILSIKIEGSGLIASTPADSIKAHVQTSVSHKLIDVSVSITEVGTVTDKINVKSSSKIELTSPLGLNVVLEHTGLVGFNIEEITAESNVEGTVKAGPVYGSTTATQSFSIFPFKPEAKIDSSLKFDSTVVTVQNTLAATFSNGELAVVSNTNAFEDLLTHAAELSFKENKLSLKCDTNALTVGMKIHNQAEASAGAGAVTLKMETNADHTENRVYSLVTASLDVNGLAVNSDANIKLFEHEATQKATLTMNKDGLATSGTTTLQSPLIVENTFAAGLDSSKATLSIDTKAALNDVKVENTNALTLTLSTLAFTSKAEAIVTERTSYTHDITIDLQPYTVSANVNNHLKVLDANLVNEAQLKAELYKLDFTGSLKAAYGEEEIKHTYEINYADLTANAKCSIIGKLLGTHMSQNTELEVVGLAARIHNDARFNSQPLRFDHTIRASVIPFDFNLDAIFNADGDLTLYGKQSAQLYGKFLVKAQPLALASSHECRASVTQLLDNGFALETTVDNKLDALMTPQEQKAVLRLKSKVNDHALNQEVEAYHNAERLGLEVSSTLLTNLLNTDDSEKQEFTMSGFLKYDKNTESHFIQLPLIESLPAILESIKITSVSMAEALQNYLNNEEIKAKLEALPQRISDFAVHLNLEGKAVQLKQNLIALTQEYAITVEDLEATLANLKSAIEALLADIASRIEIIVAATKEVIMSGTLSETVIQRIQQEMNTFYEEYDIRAMIVAVIETIDELIKQIDMQKLKDTSIAFLHDIDIKAKVEQVLGVLKQFITSFDTSKFLEDLKSFIASLHLEAHIEELMAQIPTEVISKFVDSVKEVILDFDIIGKVNALHGKLREVIVQLEADKKVEAILEKVLELIHQFKIDETIQVVANSLKSIDIPAKVKQVLEEAINYLKATEMKQVIDHLNENLDSVVQKIKSFDYNAHVDEVNQMISGYTTYLNELIKALEIPQKFEATRDFVNFVLSSVMTSIEQLREIKVADLIKKVRDVVDHAMLNDLKAVLDTLKQKISEMDVKAEILSYLQLVNSYYTKAITIITDALVNVVEVIKSGIAEQPIVGEVKQIVEGIVTGLKATELDLPSFTIPLTDLVVPSLKITLEKLQGAEIPTQLDIPEFTILGFHTVPALTITVDDIKQRIVELIDFISNFEIKMFDVDAFFGELTMNYLPTLPEIALPEITLPEISLPSLPHVPIEKLLEIPTLQIPEIKLPKIPCEVMIPSFGKLYGEVRIGTPIYNLRTTAELQNSTDSEMTPQLTVFLTSQATSPSFEIFNYNLDSTARIAIPKMSRVIVAETLKFTHSALAVEHQASVTLYGIAAQASAKTTVKATTAPYTADIVNNIFFATEGGMSASVDTTYNHQLKFPIIGLSSETALTSKAVARQEGTTIVLTIGNEGTAKFNSHDGTHKSDLHFTLNPSTAKLTFTSDTDTAILKMKQTMNAEAVILSYFKFDARSEAEGPAVKSSLVVASGHANMGDLKVELKAAHDSELVGGLSGILSNSFNLVISPDEVVLDFQNKGNTKLTISETLTTKMDLQNDYSATIKPDGQHINNVALVRLNQYKYSYNLTIDNNNNQAGIFAAMDGEANLDFLTTPFNIPEIHVPFVNIHTPAISNVNLYEHSGIKHILTTTEQTVDVDVKIVYQKSQFAPLVHMGLVRIPSLGNLITDLSFKSAIINLNANAGLYAEDDLVFRLGATSASVFDALKAKLDGTTSLTTKRGLKLATALSLENPHIEGTHDSSITLNTDNMEADVSVSTVAKIALPILNVEANQQFAAHLKTNANAASTLKLKGDFHLPLINVVGKADLDHSLKLEEAFGDHISMETFTKINLDGTILETYPLLAAVDNEANMYLNADGLRSTSKLIANAKLNNGETKILEIDVDENLAVEASLTRVYVVLKVTSNNEANVMTFITNGKHVAQATIDLAPTTSLNADVEIAMSQPSTFGDITIFEKTVVELTAPKQKVSTTAKIVTPVYTTSLAAEIEGDAPIFKVTLKSSATSIIVFLDYDLDASITAGLENAILSLTGKAALTHADLTMDIQHVLSQVMRKKRQEEGSDSRLTLNVDITSATFTDVNFRYAARRDGISASVSTPSTGFLGLQLQGRTPSQLNARLYSRYASAPEDDVDILIIRASVQDTERMRLKIAYNMEAPNDMLMGLKERLPTITSTLNNFADKYQLFGQVSGLKSAVINLIEEAYSTTNNHAADLSQLSILFRNTVVQYQKTVQVFLDAAVKSLREIQFKLPGSEEMTTLPEVLKKLTTGIAQLLERAVQMLLANVESTFNALMDMISNIQVTMPIGTVMSGAQFIDEARNSVKNILAQIVDLIKHLESLDMILEKLGETQTAVVEKAQQFVDTLKSDVLDAVAIYINAIYGNLVSLIKNVLDQVNTHISMEQVNQVIDYVMELVNALVSQFNNTVSAFLQNASEEAYVKVKGGRLEIDLPFNFSQ
ncbi:apolipoprotein B-100-like isoform X1 [Hypomesus transpacificus]|uniref:apolipoprotein B-100-like isoform X1 n=1 Tax=Hypomesus transpacificus TaxID=137520 RepID=UPI001F084E0A|nr:apolipoprotein B-100-like isoform X1 [Hypomesus transpacificus]